MSRVVGLFVLVVVVCLPASASEPGQPLDCSDWWSLVPGYSCVEWSGDASSHAGWFDGWTDQNDGDWSQAQPLLCGYPATAPSVGDYLTVEDTLPNPAPGQGYHYVTAVNHQGQRRYGRQANGGVLIERDPAVLPECSN